MDLPLSVSPGIAGLSFILTFGRSSPIYPFLTQHGIKIVYAVPGIMIVTIFTTFPYISRELIPVLSAQGRDEEEAAALIRSCMEAQPFPEFDVPIVAEAAFGPSFGELAEMEVAR